MNLFLLALIAPGGAQAVDSRVFTILRTNEEPPVAAFLLQVRENQLPQ